MLLASLPVQPYQYPLSKRLTVKHIGYRAASPVPSRGQLLFRSDQAVYLLGTEAD